MTQRIAVLIRRGATHPTFVGSRREDGQGLVEYALIIGLIAVAVVGAVAGLGTALLNLYNTFPGAF